MAKHVWKNTMNNEIKTLLKEESESRRRVNEALLKSDFSFGKQLSDSMDRIAAKLAKLSEKRGGFSPRDGEEVLDFSD